MPPWRAALERFSELRDRILAETGVIGCFNLALVRTIEPPALNAVWFQELLDLAGEQAEAAEVGIDLLSNEVDATALATGSGMYGPVVAARQEGRIYLKCTMDAGEVGDV